jgi:hypothetical protein
VKSPSRSITAAATEEEEEDDEDDDDEPYGLPGMNSGAEGVNEWLLGVVLGKPDDIN